MILRFVFFWSFFVFTVLFPGVFYGKITRGNCPDVYFYPPPERLPDNSVISSPLALSLHQVTAGFPMEKDYKGVVVVVPWSVLAPTATTFDFKLIDDTITYWRLRRKKVILSVSTGGPAFRTLEGDQPTMQQETPKWLTDLGLSYCLPGDSIGSIALEKRPITCYPRYWDKRILGYILGLIRQLGRRYNGNSTISYVRISTGLVGEDAPAPFGPHPEKAPGYSFQAWMNYSQKVLSEYLDSFNKTELEYDISYLPWGYVTGDVTDKQSADHFMDRLNTRNVFVAFDGWQEQASVWYKNSDNPRYALNRLMFYLRSRVSMAKPVGLEALGPMMVPAMKNTDSLVKVANWLHVRHFVMFGLDGAGIKLFRSGSSPTTRSSEQWAQEHGFVLGETGALASELLSEICK